MAICLSFIEQNLSNLEEFGKISPYIMKFGRNREIFLMTKFCKWTGGGHFVSHLGYIVHQTKPIFKLGWEFDGSNLHSVHKGGWSLQ